MERTDIPVAGLFYAPIIASHPEPPSGDRPRLVAGSPSGDDVGSASGDAVEHLKPGHHQHPRDRGLDPQEPTLVSQRGLRDRKIPPPHRSRHRGRAEKGYRVRYTLATRLVNELVQAADEKMLAKTIARYGRGALICIDELGYMELDRRGAELLSQVLTEQEEKKSIAVASNESFSVWTKNLHGP